MGTGGSVDALIHLPLRGVSGYSISKISRFYDGNAPPCASLLARKVPDKRIMWLKCHRTDMPVGV
jgi:hypothetical protein